jgi:hypothetical protein
MKLRLLSTLLAVALVLPTQSPAATIGDWEMGSTDDGQLYAGVMNDSGGLLMKGCKPSLGVCYWYLIIATSCEGHQESPALVSSSAGTAAINLACDGPSQADKTLYRYRIAEPDLIDLAIKSTKPLGIALPLKDGRFGVFRFSMVGAERAVAVLMQGASKLNGAGQNGTAKSGTRDSTL